jgi:hypothetical protein
MTSVDVDLEIYTVTLVITLPFEFDPTDVFDLDFYGGLGHTVVSTLNLVSKDAPVCREVYRKDGAILLKDSFNDDLLSSASPKTMARFTLSTTTDRSILASDVLVPSSTVVHVFASHCANARHSSILLGHLTWGKPARAHTVVVQNKHHQNLGKVNNKWIESRFMLRCGVVQVDR